MSADLNSESDNPVPEPETTRSLVIFGRNVSEMPCFRNSFLYGMTSGIGVGFATFMGTSRPALSMHCTMAGFTCVTLGYWFTCRYQFSKTKFEMAKLQRAMRERAVLEGTDLEREIMANSKSA